MRVFIAPMATIVALSVAFSIDSSPAWARARATQVSGTVSTSDGARLPHATLVLTDTASGRQYRGSSDDLGAFVLDRLLPGSYDLVVEFPGLSTRSIRGIVVHELDGARVDVVLDPATVRELVTVSAAVPRDSVELTEVRESPARDVGELLAENTGLWKLRKGGIANDVVLRGLQSRDLNVLIDGNRLYGACPNHMDPPAFHVDFSQVERVDVGKGPFDVRYQGSLGGIVNIVTRRPDEGWHANAAVGAGSFGFVNPSTTLSYGNATLSLLGGASYRRSAPYADGRGRLMTSGAGYRGESAESDAFRATTLWGRGAWRPLGDHQLEVSYTRQQTDHTLYPYLLMDAVYDNADRVSVDYTGPTNGPRVHAIKAQAYWSAVDHWMTDAFRMSSGTAPRGYSMGTDAQTFTGGGRVEARVAALGIGVEAFRRNWNSETMMAGMGAYAPQYSIPDVNIDSIGVFVEHARPLASRTALDLGGRIDRIRSSADATKANVALYAAYHDVTATSRADVLPSGRAKLTYQIAADLDVSAAVGHTARVAEGNERFFALRRMGTDWVGNPALAPTRNTGLDVALSFRRPRLNLTANGYVNAVRDYVAVYSASRRQAMPGVMNTVARSYANVDAMLRGFEGSGTWTVRSPFSVSADVSFVRGTMSPRTELGMTSTNLAETPPLRGRLRVRADNGRLFAEVEGVASAAQMQVDRSLGEATTPAYTIANVTTGLRKGALSMTVGVANVFDRYFVEHLSFQRDPFRSGLRVAEPGRNVFTNVSWKF